MWKLLFDSVIKWHLPGFKTKELSCATYLDTLFNKSLITVCNKIYFFHFVISGCGDSAHVKIEDVAGELRWGATINKVTWSFVYVVTKYFHFHEVFATKLDKVVYSKRPLPKESCETLIMGHVRSSDKFKNLLHELYDMKMIFDNRPSTTKSNDSLDKS